MKNTGSRTNILDRVLDEYVMYGGPIVTRREALADCQAKGYEGRSIDVLVFGRPEVAAPADPEAHVAFLRVIQQMGW